MNDVETESTALTLSRICLHIWDTYALPAAEAAYDLMIATLDVLQRDGRTAGAGMIRERLSEFDRALARMSRWTESQPTTACEEGIRAFEAWHRAYLDGVREVLWCDARYLVRLGGSALVLPYARWKGPHRALRDVLYAPSSAGSDMHSLSEEFPFRRLREDVRDRAPEQERGARHACFLDGARTHFVLQALRVLDERISDEAEGSEELRAALEALAATGQLSAPHLAVLEDFVADVSRTIGAGTPGDGTPVWTLRQRLKSIERDLSSHPE